MVAGAWRRFGLANVPKPTATTSRRRSTTGKLCRLDGREPGQEPRSWASMVALRALLHNRDLLDDRNKRPS